MFALSRAPITMPSLNPWEDRALAHDFSRSTSSASGDKLANRSRHTFKPGQDSAIYYPGLYAPSGINVMAVLFGVFARPDPKVQLGPVDCSVALTVCNLDLPGSPIIYANDAFSNLTGYTAKEVVGKNLRFLHSPHHHLYPSANHLPLDQHSTATINRLDQAVASRNEIQLFITNYKTNGQKFRNLMSLIPIQIPNDETQYAACFHVATDS